MDCKLCNDILNTIKKSTGIYDDKMIEFLLGEILTSLRRQNDVVSDTFLKELNIEKYEKYINILDYVDNNRHKWRLRGSNEIYRMANFHRANAEIIKFKRDIKYEYLNGGSIKNIKRFLKILAEIYISLSIEVDI